MVAATPSQTTRKANKMSRSCPTNASTYALSHSVDTLTALLYDELRRLARAYFRNERPGHTLQPTALVHEAYLRVKPHAKKWQHETDFRRYTARVMRNVLVDCARRRRQHTALTLSSSDGAFAVFATNADVLVLHEALLRLEGKDAKLAELVEHHYFGGLTIDEIAEQTSVPRDTIRSRIRTALTFLRRELSKKG